jgi:hypothetical protein
MCQLCHDKFADKENSHNLLATRKHIDGDGNVIGLRCPAARKSQYSEGGCPTGRATVSESQEELDKHIAQGRRATAAITAQKASQRMSLFLTSASGQSAAVTPGAAVDDLGPDNTFSYCLDRAWTQKAVSLCLTMFHSWGHPRT